MKLSRRNFLKSMGLTAGSLLLPSCTSLERIYSIRSRDLTDKVVILGGGLAGLNAALELKKAGVPYFLFEGSSRLGGRAYSLDNFANSQQSVDLGAEWIYSSQSAVLQLAKDLRVGLTEYPFTHYLTTFKEGQWKDPSQSFVQLQLATSKILNELYMNSQESLSARNQANFPKAVVFDSLSVQQMLERLSTRLSPEAVDLGKVLSRIFWGESHLSANSLMFLHRMRTLGKSRSAFRINGGAQNLAEALFERVAGIIPDRFVSLNHELVSIKKNTADYNLEFTTHDGLVEFKAKKIICALPLSVLKNMEGLNQLGLPAEFLQFMNECGQVKSSRITLATQQRDWKDSPFKAHFWSFENKDFFITEGPRDLSQNLAEPMGILQAHLTGVSEKNLGPQTAEDVKKVIQSSISKTISFKEVHLHSWSRSRWSKSAFVFLKPQQITKLPSFEQVHEDWKFCGDYAVSEHIGTMNASVISSNLAAKQMRV